MVISWYFVAPLVGAWIEINLCSISFDFCIVAPLVGAWIEIANFSQPYIATKSLPLWERGLKYKADNPGDVPVHRRSPCGSVD